MFYSSLFTFPFPLICINTAYTSDFFFARFGRDVFQRVGMLPASSIRYEDFILDGKSVFAGMQPPDTEITFMKKKFFQSALKHIL